MKVEIVVAIIVSLSSVLLIEGVLSSSPILAVSSVLLLGCGAIMIGALQL